MLRYKYFPNVNRSAMAVATTEIYQYLHNLETDVVERKLQLKSTTPDFQVEEAFLAGQLSLLEQLLELSPFNEEQD